VVCVATLVSFCVSVMSYPSSDNAAVSTAKLNPQSRATYRTVRSQYRVKTKRGLVG
jgi:hypothetical protein